MKHSRTKVNFDPLYCSALTTAASCRKCRCLQRLRPSRSDPCLICLVSLRPRNNFLSRHQRYFTASGESGFASDSDNPLRRRHCEIFAFEPPSLDTDRSPHASGHFRALSFPLPAGTLGSLQSHYQYISSKGW